MGEVGWVGSALVQVQPFAYLEKVLLVSANFHLHNRLNVWWVVNEPAKAKDEKKGKEGKADGTREEKKEGGGGSGGKKQNNEDGGGDDEKPKGGNTEFMTMPILLLPEM